MAAGENLLLNRLRNSAGLNEEVKHIVGTNPKRESAMCSDCDLQQSFCNERKHSTRMSSEFPKGTRYLRVASECRHAVLGKSSKSLLNSIIITK